MVYRLKLLPPETEPVTEADLLILTETQIPIPRFGTPQQRYECVGKQALWQGIEARQLTDEDPIGALPHRILSARLYQSLDNMNGGIDEETVYNSVSEWFRAIGISRDLGYSWLGLKCARMVLDQYGSLILDQEKERNQKTLKIMESIRRKLPAIEDEIDDRQPPRPTSHDWFAS